MNRSRDPGAYGVCAIHVQIVLCESRLRYVLRQLWGLKIDYASGAEYVHIVIQKPFLNHMHSLVCALVQVTLDVNESARTTAPARDTGLAVAIAVIGARVNGRTTREMPWQSAVIAYIVVAWVVPVLVLLPAILVFFRFSMPAPI